MDIELQEKLGLASFFSSRGYKSFKEKLDDIKLGADNSVNNMGKVFISQDRFAELNFNLGFKRGIETILFVLGNMQEELEDVDR